MSVQTACPACQEEYTLDDSLRGKRVKCQKCGDKFLVGKRGGVEDLPEVTLADDDYDDYDDYEEYKAPSKRKRSSPRPRAVDELDEIDELDEFDEDEDDWQAAKSRSALIKMLVIGVLAMVLVPAISGAVIYAVIEAKSNSAKNSDDDDKTTQVADNDTTAKDRPEPRPPVVPSHDTRSITSAFDAAGLLISTPQRVEEALQWLIDNTIVPTETARVAASLRICLQNPAVNKVQAIRVILKNGPAHNKPEVQTLLETSDDPEVVTLAMKAAALHKDKSFAPGLAKRWTEPQYREQARQILLDYGTYSTSEVFELTRNPDEQIANDAKELAKELTDRMRGIGIHASSLMQDLSSSRFDEKSKAWETLALIEPNEKDLPAVLEALVKSYGESHPAIKPKIEATKDKWVTKEAIPHLLRLLQTTTSHTRGSVMRLLLHTKDDQAVLAVAMLLNDRSSTNFAAHALRELGTEAEEPVLQVLLRTPDNGMRYRFVNLLGNIGTQKSIPVMERLVRQNRHLLPYAKSAAEKIAKRLQEEQPMMP